MSVEKPISGYKKLELMRLLATGEHSVSDLAVMYESAEGTIRQFRERHKVQIAEIVANMEDQFAGLWIAKKENRIAEYQSQAEKFRDADDPKLVARTQTALRSVAEELGALPQRLQVQQEKQTVHVVLEGVDNAKLQDGVS